MDQESFDHKKAGKSADLSSSAEFEKGFHESFGSISEGNDLRESTDGADARLEIVGSADSVSVNSGGDCSRNSHDQAVLEAVVVIKSGCKEDVACGSAEKPNLEMRNVVVNDVKVKGLQDQSYVIDVKDGGGKYGESLDVEILCRICHLSSDQLLESCPEHTMNYPNLIQLGCGCKDDLGSAHPHCAEAWFKLKGNRVCEICGETAKNVAGIGDGRFIEEWNDRSTDIGSNASRNSGGCWRGQPFCNFLMACLVVAFVLPWFFRINMF